MIGAAELAVVIARLTGVADEMGAVLRRAAFSPNIKERADCSAALFTADGELLVQAEHIPVHLGSMPASVRAALDAVGLDVEPGAHVILNDPFAGGTHLNDVTLVTPVHIDNRVVGWAANRAHHADVGGASPGSMPADAREIQQEGLRLPPIRLNADIRRVLLANSRTPAERAGDLDAQVGANVVGANRLAELLAAGVPVAEVLRYGERRMRAALSAVPDGEWMASDVLDSTGPPPAGPARIVVTLRKAGDQITFDFTGTDPQSDGNVNAVEAVTVSSVAFAVRAAVDPTIPANGGSLRPIHVIAPLGTIVAARAPAAVAAGNVEVSQRVADVCLAALAQALPARVGAAGQGTMNNVLVGGRAWIYYETIGGGQGARPGRDGMSGVHTAMTNTLNTPIEALERAYPMRVLRYRLRRDSGGAGLARGGDGIERDVLMLEDVTVSLITERRASRPWGLQGGAPGCAGENWLLPGGSPSAVPLPDKVTTRLHAGDTLRVFTPGGGGWGRSPGSSEYVVLSEPSGTVRVVDYDARWPARFEAERSRISAALGVQARRIEHVGSTSVPGLAAKPVVDVCVSIDDPDDDAAFVPALCGAGYSLLVIEPDHRMFRPPSRDVHVHLWPVGSDHERRHLLFRDWLRVDADDRDRYESVKRGLAARDWETVQQYTDAKSVVIAEIMARAEQWAGETGWQVG
jgi:N-methylhydantoinase B